MVEGVSVGEGCWEQFLGCGVRWMRTKYIGVFSENTDFHATGTRTSVAGVRRPRLSYQQSPSDTVPFRQALVVHA